MDVSIISKVKITDEAYKQIAWVTSVECPDTHAVAQAQNEEVEKYLTSGDGNVFLGNAFSLQMVAPYAIISIMECSPSSIPKEAVSCIGHPDTAAVVSNILGREIPCNRINISLKDGDVLYVAQLTGGRLPEGATQLPEGFSLTFRKVVIRC